MNFGEGCLAPAETAGCGIRDRRSDAGSRLSSRARVRVECRPHTWARGPASERAACPQGESPCLTETDTKVHAEVRENFGKGFARRLRAAGKIPAVIYGHGTTPVHVALPGHQVALLIRRANAVLELDVDGKQQLTLVKDVQKDPVHQIIEHIDLLVVKKGEKIQVDVPVSIIGESAPGTIAAQDANTVLLEVEATHIPERIEFDVEGLEEGTHITAADLTLPAGRVAGRRPRDADRRHLDPVVDARRRGRDRRGSTPPSPPSRPRSPRPRPSESESDSE